MDDKTDNSVPVKTGSNNSASNSDEPANDDGEFLDEPPFNSPRPSTDTVTEKPHRSFFGAAFHLLMVIVFLAVLVVGTALATIYVLKI